MSRIIPSKLLTTSAARADIPAGFEEPDEDQAKQSSRAAPPRVGAVIHGAE